MTVAEQKIYYLQINKIQNEYSIIKDESPAPPFKIVGLEGGIEFKDILDLTDDKIIFNSYGAVSEPGEIILKNSQNNTITINVKPSGFVKISE